MFMGEDWETIVWQQHVGCDKMISHSFPLSTTNTILKNQINMCFFMSMKCILI
jgi:hypothetical protein